MRETICLQRGAIKAECTLQRIQMASINHSSCDKYGVRRDILNDSWPVPFWIAMATREEQPLIKALTMTSLYCTVLFNETAGDARARENSPRLDCLSLELLVLLYRSDLLSCSCYC